MAKPRFRGPGAITLWMIIFVGLWLTSTVFLVILYTGQEGVRNENERLEAANRRLISRSQESSLELARSARESGPTVVGLLEDARAQTALLATGDEADDSATVRSKRDALLRAIEDEALVGASDNFSDISLHEALATLYEAFKAEHAKRRDAEDKVEAAEARVQEMTRASEELKSAFDRQAKDLSDQLAQVEANRAAYVAERDQTVARLEREFGERLAQADADLAKEREQRARAEQRLAGMQVRFAAQQAKFGDLMVGPEELSTARKPDGRVLTAVPGDDVVFIDLGRKDRLTLGLRFAVYSAETGIPSDGKGKAQIEVVSISDESAECRIVNVVGNEVVLEGDLVANPVYDRIRSLTFLVIGVFDLDRDGAPDRTGTATIESMITHWGGSVATEPDALTDFLVLGAAPRQPRPASDVSPEQAEQNRARQAEWDRYYETLEWAKSLSVPVMPQDVFLNFLGYGGRYAQR